MAINMHTKETKLVFEWRVDQLCKLGLPTDEAMLHALDENVNLRDMEKLVNAGCPANVAIRILT